MNVIKYNLTVSQLYENYEHVLLKCTETQTIDRTALLNPLTREFHIE